MCLYFTYMYADPICLSVVCTCTSSVCHSYVLACHRYVNRMYSYLICMSIVCTRISFVCHSYVLVCHPYVTRLWFYQEPKWNIQFFCFLNIYFLTSHEHFSQLNTPVIVLTTNCGTDQSSAKTHIVFCNHSHSRAVGIWFICRDSCIT